MFFIRLTKKTLINSRRDLKFKYVFWNKLRGELCEVVTHKIDYIPDSWIVTQFSSLHPSLVYDTDTFTEFFYLDPSKLFLQINQMSLDDTWLPSKNRNIPILSREYRRVYLIRESNNANQLLARSKSGLQKNPLLLLRAIPNQYLFLTTNFIFLWRSQIRKKRQEYKAWLRNFNKERWRERLD